MMLGYEAALQAERGHSASKRKKPFYHTQMIDVRVWNTSPQQTLLHNIYPNSYPSLQEIRYQLTSFFSFWSMLAVMRILEEDELLCNGPGIPFVLLWISSNF